MVTVKLNSIFERLTNESHFVKLSSTFLLIFAFFANSLSFAKSPKSDFIKRFYSIEFGQNPAKLVNLDSIRLSEVEIFSNFSTGNFYNYNESPTSFLIGAKTSSIYRLNQKIVLTGAFGYSNFTQKSAAGSIFIEPENAPFDIVELSDTCRGRKRLENYDWEAALAFAISPKFSLGASIKYNAANYAKQRDLRHTNTLMNLSLSVAIDYAPWRFLSFGLSGNYRRRNESLSFKTFGTTDRVYDSLISYGAFFGVPERFGEDGLTGSSSSVPLFDSYFGGKFSILITPIPKLKIAPSISFDSRKGFYGKATPTDIGYMNHAGNQIIAKIIVNYFAEKTLHNFAFSFEQKSLSTERNIYRRENSAGGLSQIVYYGASKVGLRKNLCFSASYQLDTDVQENLPKYSFSIDFKQYNRNGNATIFPAMEIYSLKYSCTTIALHRNIPHKNNVFAIDFSAAYQGGKASAEEVSLSSQQSTTLKRRMEIYYDQETDFYTKQQIHTNLGFAYSRKLTKMPLELNFKLNYQRIDADFSAPKSMNSIIFSASCSF